MTMFRNVWLMTGKGTTQGSIAVKLCNPTSSEEARLGLQLPSFREQSQDMLLSRPRTPDVCVEFIRTGESPREYHPELPRPHWSHRHSPAIFPAQPQRLPGQIEIGDVSSVSLFAKTSLTNWYKPLWVTPQICGYKAPLLVCPLHALAPQSLTSSCS